MWFQEGWRECSSVVWLRWVFRCCDHGGALSRETRGGKHLMGLKENAFPWFGCGGYSDVVIMEVLYLGRRGGETLDGVEGGSGKSI